MVTAPSGQSDSQLTSDPPFSPPQCIRFHKKRGKKKKKKKPHHRRPICGNVFLSCIINQLTRGPFQAGKLRHSIAPTQSRGPRERRSPPNSAREISSSLYLRPSFFFFTRNTLNLSSSDQRSVRPSVSFHEGIVYSREPSECSRRTETERSENRLKLHRKCEIVLPGNY